MSRVLTHKAYVFHTDLGAVVTTMQTIARYDVEDLIKDRAISQGRAIQFLNRGRKASPNDLSGARTMSSAYAESNEELQD